MLRFFLFLSLSIPRYLSSQPDYVCLCRYLSLSLYSPYSHGLRYFLLLTDRWKTFCHSQSLWEHYVQLEDPCIHSIRWTLAAIFSRVLQRCQAPSHLHSREDEPFITMLTHHCNMTSTLIKGVNWSHFLPALNELEESSHIRSLPQYSSSSPCLHCIGLLTSNSHFVQQKQNNTEHYEFGWMDT